MKIFFDVDGVLMNNIHSVRGWINRWDNDLEKDLGIHHEKFQEIFKGWFLDVLQGRLDFQEEMDRWLAFNDFDAKAWQVINYWNEKDTNINRPVMDVVERLSSLDGVDLYIATNQTHSRANYLHDVLGFKNYFRDIYYSARLGCLKHDPYYFAQIEKDLNFDPHLDTPLYFDDDPRNVEVALARGWNAVLFDTSTDVVNHPAIKSLLGP